VPGRNGLATGDLSICVVAWQSCHALDLVLLPGPIDTQCWGYFKPVLAADLGTKHVCKVSKALVGTAPTPNHGRAMGSAVVVHASSLFRPSISDLDCRNPPSRHSARSQSTSQAQAGTLEESQEMGQYTQILHSITSNVLRCAAVASRAEQPSGCWQLCSVHSKACHICAT
jgi:hypothetical protein